MIQRNPYVPYSVVLQPRREEIFQKGSTNASTYASINMFTPLCETLVRLIPYLELVATMISILVV